MKQFWRILIKSLLVITGLALVILLVAGLVLILDWPGAKNAAAAQGAAVR